MKIFLIEFTYSYYCQGTDTGYTSELVYASDFDNACKKITGKYNDTLGNGYDARDFKNKTIL